MFEEEGVDMNRVYIGHNNDSTDMAYLLEILGHGVWLGLDRTTVEARDPDWRERAHMIKKLIDAGWGHRILVGHDTMVYSGQNGKGPEDPPPHMQGPYKNTNNYCFLIEQVLPLVVELGATQAQVDKITHDNPRRFFENRS
jgi:phosphotriesterase-related protein